MVSTSSLTFFSFLAEYEEYLKNDTGDLFECQFSDDTCKFYCAAYFAKDFHQLRSTIFEGGNTSHKAFLSSLSECRPWEAKCGKSGSDFFKTLDDRFILKQMSQFEFKSFQTLAQPYFNYINEAVTTSKPTALAKIVGVYRLGFKNSATNNSFRMELLIIENLFYGIDIDESYDLKGSIRNRNANKTDSSLVLMDENLLKLACTKPLYISEDSKQLLLEAIKADSEFLANHQLMDYSLLVGMKNESHEMVIGIIDYLRTFTWDKRLEQLVKSSGLLGGAGKTPTVISPKLYMTRFQEAMYKYFIMVPDFWYSGAAGGDQPSSSTAKTTEPAMAATAPASSATNETATLAEVTTTTLAAADEAASTARGASPLATTVNEGNCDDEESV